MARATFVKAARKDNKDAGIKKGESYYWWKFRYGGKHYSKTPPRASQLTGSAFLSQVYAALELIEDLKPPFDAEDAALAIRDASEQIQQAGEEQSDNLSNMPDGLQQGDTGQMMEQRASDCDQLASDLEQIADDLDVLATSKFDEDKEDGESEEDFKERIASEVESKVEEAMGMSYDGE